MSNIKDIEIRKQQIIDNITYLEQTIPNNSKQIINYKNNIIKERKKITNLIRDILLKEDLFNEFAQYVFDLLIHQKKLDELETHLMIKLEKIYSSKESYLSEKSFKLSSLNNSEEFNKDNLNDLISLIHALYVNILISYNYTDNTINKLNSKKYGITINKLKKLVEKTKLQQSEKDEYIFILDTLTQKLNKIKLKIFRKQLYKIMNNIEENSSNDDDLNKKRDLLLKKICILQNIIYPNPKIKVYYDSKSLNELYEIHKKTYLELHKIYEIYYREIDINDDKYIFLKFDNSQKEMKIHDLETLRIILYEAIIKKDEVDFSIKLQQK